MDIRVKDLSVHIGKKNIIKDINVDVDNGEFVGIVGPNGSGKSTSKEVTIVLSLIIAISAASIA